MGEAKSGTSMCRTCSFFIKNGQCKKGKERVWFDNDACDDYKSRRARCKFCMGTPASGYGGMCKHCYEKLTLVRSMQYSLRKEND